jgi:hypothetical protein
MVNMRLEDPGGRKRISPRGRLARAFFDALPGGCKVLQPMGKASAITQRWGPRYRLDGGFTRTQGTIAGNVRVVDGNGNTFYAYGGVENDSVTGVPGVGTRVHVDASEDVTAARGQLFRGVYCENYRRNYGGTGDRFIGRVGYLKMTSANAGGQGPITQDWTAEVLDANPGFPVAPTPVNIVVRSIASCGPWVFVAANNYVYCFAADTTLGYTAGQYVQRFTVPNALRVQKIVALTGIVRDPLNGNSVVYAENQAELLILFDGETTVSGLVTTSGNSEGLYARAGIHRCTINLRTTGAVALTIASAPFASPTTPNPDSHASWRFREWSGTGRGRAPLDMAVFSAPGADIQTEVRSAPWVKCLVATTNDGFGPTTATADKPAGSGGYANVWCVDAGRAWNAATGSYDIPSPVKWKVDSESIKANWQTSGFFNDIPYNTSGVVNPDNGLGPESSANAITVNPATGAVFVGGKTSFGFNVFGINLNTGGIAWRGSVGGMVPQQAVAFYVGSSAAFAQPAAVMVGTQRNATWPGNDGANAALFFLDPDSGAVRRTRDFGSGINVVSVSAGRGLSSTFGMVGTTYFSE